METVQGSPNGFGIGAVLYEGWSNALKGDMLPQFKQCIYFVHQVLSIKWLVHTNSLTDARICIAKANKF